MGCVVAVLLGIVLLCLAGFLAGRIVATPDLGAAVRGPDHGTDVSQIAAASAASIALQLASHDHAVIVLSEKDLTVLARQRNPDPEKFLRPEVRVRSGFMLLSAETTVGPLHSIAVAHVTVLLLGVTEGSARVETDITGLTMGRLDIPDPLRPGLDPRGNGALSIDPIFNDPGLKDLRSTLECIFIGNDGVHIGFHKPGVKADTTSCHPPELSSPI